MKTISIFLVLLLSLSATAVAQDKDDWQSWPLADRFTISVEAFFTSLDTKVRIDASDGALGTTIDFEQNLGMSDAETLPGFAASWRFAKKHELVLDVFNLDRSGSAIATTNITIGDETFSANLPISSFLDMKVTSLGYSYSLVLDERKELGISVGLSLQDIQLGLLGNGALGNINVESGITAPVPSFGLNGGYAFTDKWVGKAGFGLFSFDLELSNENQLAGEILNGFASIEHLTFEHVHFGLSYNYFDIRVDWTENARDVRMGYVYQGPMLTVRAAF
jgi:hypothetical protein